MAYNKDGAKMLFINLYCLGKPVPDTDPFPRQKSGYSNQPQQGKETWSEEAIKKFENKE